VIYSSRPPEPEVLRKLTLTQDGTIALGVWRERKLHTQPAPTPALSGRDRAVVELAARALALGTAWRPVMTRRGVRHAAWHARGGSPVGLSGAGLARWFPPRLVRSRLISTAPIARQEAGRVT
jgi:hypothetical protein